MDSPSSIGLVSPDSPAIRYEPQPNGSSFRQILNTVGSAAATIATGALSGIDGGAQFLLMEQLRVQQQMQMVSLASNVIKSEHETQMAAVRNIRVG